MIHSKILKAPEFKPIPKTNAANVQENIENWLNRGLTKKIETFCRKDETCPTGYRFIRTEDLDETIVTNQTISGLEFEITWYRRLHTRDHFCPLYFSVWFIEVTLKHKDEVFQFKSDNNIRVRIKNIKSLKH